MYHKRLRMFAGPNGSGKSTVFKELEDEHNFDLGIYLNADKIAEKLTKSKSLQIEDFGINSTYKESDFQNFITTHTLYNKASLEGYSINLTLESNSIHHNSESVSYEAAILADFFRQELMKSGKKFSFETVMSHESKLETLKKARDNGYKNYLYFISTENVEINKNRVKQRVKQGGHNVPEDKIIKRYYASLGFLKDAVKLTHRAYIFDNSGKESNLILDILDGVDITYRHDKIPTWVDKYLGLQ